MKLKSLLIALCAAARGEGRDVLSSIHAPRHPRPFTRCSGVPGASTAYGRRSRAVRTDIASAVARAIENASASLA